jgi:nucleoside-diphosphate-sugar epimerase
MKTLITGGCGQVGSHVAELFLARGDQVLAIDNLETGRREHLPQRADGLTYAQGSIADKGLIDRLFEDFRPDVVVHTAASYKDPEDWHTDAMTNTVGGANVIHAAKRHKAKRFIYFQTALCYGVKPEESPITLNHPRRPANSSYSITKSAAEDFLDISGLDWVTFRLANVAGARAVSGPIPIFYQRLKSGKRCFVTPARRDFVYVGDLAKIVVRAADGTGSGAYHFSSGGDVPIQQLYDEVVRAMKINDYPEPEKKPLLPDDAPSILLDPSRTFRDFGKIEFTPLSTLVEKAIAYYDKFGTQGEYTHLKLINDAAKKA